MKPLAQHIQEGLNESNKTLVELIVGDSDNELGLPESNSEENTEIDNDSTENEKPTE